MIGPSLLESSSSSGYEEVYFQGKNQCSRIFEKIQALPVMSEGEFYLRPEITQLRETFDLMKESYIFLKKKGKLDSDEIRFYERVRDAAVTRPREHRLVLDAEIVQEKLGKQLEIAEIYRNNQSEHKLNKGNLGPAFVPLEALDEETPGVTVTSERLVADAVIYDVGISQAQGKKTGQEDRSLAASFSLTDLEGCEHNVVLVGVFDGHGGISAA